MNDHRHDRRLATEARPGSDGQQRSLAGRRFSRRALNGPETVEAYIRADSPPRYMRRLREIETLFRAHRRRLEAAYRALEEAAGHDAELFAHRWRARAHAWRFDRLNELIRQHNDWYPIERNLPMDPRTRDYVPVRGQSYRRLEL